MNLQAMGRSAGPFGTTIEGELLLERLRGLVDIKRAEQINQQSM